MGTLTASLVDDGGRQAILLENDRARVVVDAQGGMMPEFSIRRGKGFLNTHWLPHFRGNGGPRFEARRHAEFWKSGLLYHIAGDFTCAPNFGAGCEVDGVKLPPHGQAASETWKLEGHGVAKSAAKRPGAAWAAFSLELRQKPMPLSFRKYDVVFEGQPAFYSLLRIANRGAGAVVINIGRHATLGPPFLQAGCLVSVGAHSFMTPPRGSEFDMTGRLALGVEFPDLASAPLREVGTVDLGFVPGPIGATDLVVGAVPLKAELGWSCVVNPALALAHVAFFPGPAALRPDEVAPAFNILWMQYGGRRFTPWAAREGGSDQAFCLGVEHAASGFANGLAYARSHPEILGSPTTVVIPGRSERIFRYGCLIAELGNSLHGAVQRVDAVEEGLVLSSGHSKLVVPADSHFEGLLEVAERIDSGKAGVFAPVGAGATEGKST